MFLAILPSQRAAAPCALPPARRCLSADDSPGTAPFSGARSSGVLCEGRMRRSCVHTDARLCWPLLDRVQVIEQLNKLVNVLSVSSRSEILSVSCEFLYLQFCY
uniref:Uncharacterized protein n=2 Tax=Arundo donax TaxID=35708 RepID=A0A0A9GM44_ARUDO